MTTKTIKRGVSLLAGYFTAKALWAAVVALDYGQLPWPWHSTMAPAVMTIYDLGTVISVLGAIIGAFVFEVFFASGQERESSK